MGNIDSPVPDPAPQPLEAKRVSPLKRLLRILVGVLIGSALLAAIIVLLIFTLGEHEAHYENKRLYDWITLLKSPNPASSNAAQLVLDRTIIPQLSRDMFQDTNDSRLRLFLIENLNTLPEVNIYYRTADTRRADAATRLGDFGPAAKAATPALVRGLQGNDAPVRAASAEALGKIQADPPIVIPLLIKCLDDELVNEAAALALADYGPPAKAAVPKLIKLSTVPDKDLHRAVVLALTKIDPEAAAQAGVH